MLTKGELHEIGFRIENNCMRCFECAFGKKAISSRLWPHCPPADPVLFLLVRYVKEKRYGNNPRTGDYLKKKFKN